MFSDFPGSGYYLFLTACAFVLGCCIGSFMNVVVWRLPRGESLVYPPSHCPKCGHQISAWENIPILSWLFLRARCSGCHQPISIRYPLGECATGLLFTFVWSRIASQHLPLEVAPAYFYLCTALLAASLIDVEHHFIPDEITVSGMLAALSLSIAWPESHVSICQGGRPTVIFSGFHHLACTTFPLLGVSNTFSALLDVVSGALFGFMPLFGIGFAINLLLPHRRDGHDSCEAAVGGGDLKLLAMIGAFLGADAAVRILLFSSILAVSWWVIRRVVGHCSSYRIPLAPFVSVAALWYMCFMQGPFEITSL